MDNRKELPKYRWLCNMCGREIRDAPAPLIVNQMIGYGSIYDLHMLKLQLCPKCTDKMITSCKINPVKDCKDILVSIISDYIHQREEVAND